MRDQDKEPFIVFSDIVQFLCDIKGKIFLGALVFGLIGVLATFKQPVTYLSRATFQESSRVDSGNPGSIFKSVLQSVGMAQVENYGMSTMKSKRILLEVIKKVGLQADVQDRGLWQRIKDQVSDVIQAERNEDLREPDPFVFENLDYQGEKTLKYFLFFTSGSFFEVRDQRHRVLAKGELEERIDLETSSFTLLEVPQNLKVRHPYLLSISPVDGIVEDLADAILMSRSDSMLSIKYPHRNRKIGVAVVNEIMEAYSHYLKKENDELCTQQLAYLEKRKQEFCERMDTYLKTHVAYLKENVGQTGFFNVNEEFKLAKEKQEKMSQRLLELNLEQSRVSSPSHALSHSSSFSNAILSLQNDIFSKQKRRDEIHLALMQPLEGIYASKEGLHQKLENVAFRERAVKTHPESIDLFFSKLINDLALTVKKRDQIEQNGFTRILSPRAHELKEVRKQMKTLDGVIQDLEAGKSVRTVRVNWEEGTDLTDPKDLLLLARHQQRMLSLKESICRERLTYQAKEGKEFQGVDLTTAEGLYLDYIRTRDDLQAKMKQLDFSKVHLDESDFEFISLVNVLPDSISQDMARSGGQIVQTLRDKRNYSEKDRERMVRKLERLKQNLHKYIDQTKDLFHLQIGLVEQKMRLIQGVSLDLLSQEISLLKTQMQDRIQGHLSSLQNERSLLEEEMDSLNEKMETYPDKWLKEYQLQFSSEMNLNMLEAMARLVESKNIEYHLIPIRSKVVDPAYASLVPKPPHLTLFGLLGAFLGMLVAIAFFFTVRLFKGFPVTEANLKLRGLVTFGKFRQKDVPKSLEKIQENELHILREITLFLKKPHQIVSLIMGTVKDYSPLVAALLAKEGKSVLLIQMDFATSHPSGLAAYIKEKVDAPQIQHQEGFDQVHVGGQTAFGFELLKHHKFRAFLEEKRKAYDHILLATPSSPNLAESRALTLLSHGVIVTLHRASASDLTPYVDWEAGESDRALGFVFS